MRVDEVAGNIWHALSDGRIRWGHRARGGAGVVQLETTRNPCSPRTVSDLETNIRGSPLSKFAFSFNLRRCSEVRERRAAGLDPTQDVDFLGLALASQVGALHSSTFLLNLSRLCHSQHPACAV